MITLKTLIEYEEKGLLRYQIHDTLPLTIWNYSTQCSYERAWDDITLRCRGLVTDDKGNVCNNPISKFFNWQEPEGKYAGSFKKEKFEAFKKLDGSLIQVFVYDNQIVVTSRGSFYSDHAKWAFDLIKDNQEFKLDHTYCFELIHPENRIVLDYGKKKALVLLAVRDKKGDLGIDNYPHWDRAEKVDLDIKKFKDLKNIPQVDGEEGYVVRFESGNRLKIKFDEYCRLHRIITNTSARDVWVALKHNLDMDEFIDQVPDEFLKWFYQKVGELTIAYKKIERAADEEWQNSYSHKVKGVTRKELAELWKNSLYKSILFARLDEKKDYSKLIWDMIKPEAERAF